LRDFWGSDVLVIGKFDGLIRQTQSALGALFVSPFWALALLSNCLFNCSYFAASNCLFNCLLNCLFNCLFNWLLNWLLNCLLN
jgi:hypothetical protein